MIDLQESAERLEAHLRELTVKIGERSVGIPENLKKTEDYIVSFYESIGLEAETESYRYEDLAVANVITRLDFIDHPSRRYLLGAHYDSVTGTVGADDNASAIAVQLETARCLKALQGKKDLDVSVKFVSFALEEPPVFITRGMGSRVHARGVKERKEKIDGMICLEMVGYTCQQPGCQSYPFPLMFMNYPKAGDFIGIVGNFKSRGLTRAIHRAFQQNKELPAIPLTVPLNGWLMHSVRRSDHASFWDSGFRAVMITDSAFFRNPHYHLPSDTMETLDYRFMAKLVESLLHFFCSHKR